MRWIVPVEGNTRKITKFLWLPVRAEGEVRWLEKATIEQYHNGKRWKNIEFVDEVGK